MVPRLINLGAGGEAQWLPNLLSKHKATNRTNRPACVVVEHACDLEVELQAIMPYMTRLRPAWVK